MRIWASLAFILAGLAACEGPVHRTSALGGAILQREGGRPKVVRERAAELKRIPLAFDESVLALRCEDFDGDLEIIGTAQGQPELRAHLRTLASDKEIAEEMLGAIRIETEREEDVLVLRLVRPDLKRPYMTNSSYELFVPTAIRVRVQNESGNVEIRGGFNSASIETSFGNVVLSGIQGDVGVTSESGNVTADRIECRRIRLVTTFGDIAMSYVRAKEVEARTRSGDISLEWVRALNTLATTSHGFIDAVGHEGSATFFTLDSSMTLHASDVKHTATLRAERGQIACDGGAGYLEIDAEYGKVTVNDFVGSVAVKSHYGNVDLGGIFEEVHAESGSGKLNVAARQGSSADSNWHLRAGFGNVVLALPASFACRLEARTGKGTIRSDFPIELETGATTAGLYGLLNGGGSRVRVESDSGRIEIQRTGN